MPYQTNSVLPGEWVGKASPQQQAGYGGLLQTMPAWRQRQDKRQVQRQQGLRQAQNQWQDGMQQQRGTTLVQQNPAWRQRQDMRQGMRHQQGRQRQDRWQDRMQQMRQMPYQGGPMPMPYNRPYQGGPVRTMPARVPLLPYGGIMGGQPGYGIGGGLEPKPIQGTPAYQQIQPGYGIGGGLEPRPAQGTPAYQQIQPGYGAPRRGWQY